MAYNYDINTSKKDNCSTICIFSCHAISEIINLFVSTFLIAYIYTFAGDIYTYIRNVSIFEGFYYFIMLIMAIPLGYLVEKTNRVWMYRLGIALRTCVVIAAIFLGKDLSKMIFLVSFINGVSYAFYYAGYNTLKQEMVSRKSIKSFSVFMQISSQIISITIPVVMGALIDVSTYAQVAVYVLVICAIQIAISFGVKAKRPDNSNFSLKGYYKKLKDNPQGKKIKYFYLGYFIYGFTTIVNTILSICIIMQFGTNLSLGAMKSVFAIVTMVSILLMSKFTKPGKRSALFIVCSLLPLVGAICFVVLPNWWSIVLYDLCISVAFIYKTLYEINRNSLHKEAGLYGEITEHQTVSEMTLDVGRIISYLCMFLISFIHNPIAFKVFLCIFSLSYSAVLLYLVFYEKKFNKPEDTNTNKK